MIINYEVVYRYNLDELNVAVKSLISKGWEPQGSLLVHTTGGNIARATFMQPMIKRLVKKEKITLD